jgi:hypothetical protein
MQTALNEPGTTLATAGQGSAALAAGGPAYFAAMARRDLPVACQTRCALAPGCPRSRYERERHDARGVSLSLQNSFERDLTQLSTAQWRIDAAGWGDGRSAMRNFAAIALCLLAGACATPEQSAGTAAGAVGGAVVGGPIGAVVGGAAGAVVAAPGGPLSPGYCYVRGRHGHILRHRDGSPVVRPC